MLHASAVLRSTSCRMCVCAREELLVRFSLQCGARTFTLSVALCLFAVNLPLSLFHSLAHITHTYTCALVPHTYDSLCGECTMLVENHDKIRALSHAHRNVSQVQHMLGGQGRLDRAQWGAQLRVGLVWGWGPGSQGQGYGLVGVKRSHEGWLNSNTQPHAHATKLHTLLSHSLTHT